MSEAGSSPEKEVIVAEEKLQISIPRIIGGLTFAALFGLAAYAWQDSAFLGILGAIAGFAFGYISGRIIY